MVETWFASACFLAAYCANPVVSSLSVILYADVVVWWL